MTPYLKNFRERLSLKAEPLRDRLAQIEALPQLTLLGLMTGILAGLVIVVFRLLIDLPLSWLLPENTENFEALARWMRFTLPFTGAAVLGLILYKVAKRFHATGISHVLDRLHNHQGRMPLGNFTTQFFGGILCLISGQSVGREGPAVHMGAASGSLLGQWLKLPNNSLRPLAGCGVSAAIAASFNTPMAGVIFAMEVVLMEYSIAGFIPVIIAAVAGATITHLVFGPDITFSPPLSPLQSHWELPLMLIAGLLVSVFAAMFIRLQGASCKLSLNYPVWLRFLIAGTVTGALALLVPQIMGVGYDTIEFAFSGELGISLLLLILMAKLLATAISLGLGIPGGVVGPCLVMGACVGGIVGIIAKDYLPMATSDLGFYVILGMGAMMGAILNAPLAAMIAILELTHNPYLIFPSMLMVVAACLTTRWAFRCDGLFQTLLRIQGKYNEPELMQQVLSRTGVRSLLDKNLLIVDRLVSQAAIQLQLQLHPHWLVLNHKPLLISPTDVQRHLELLNQRATKSDDRVSAEPDAEPTGHSSLEEHGNAAATTQEFVRGEIASEAAKPTPARDHLDEAVDIDLLEIPARRLEMIAVDAQANLYEAWQALKQAQVDALYVTNRKGVITGIITRDTLENYYRL